MSLYLSENVHCMWGKLGHRFDPWWSSSSCHFLRTQTNWCYLAFLLRASIACPWCGVHPLLASSFVILLALLRSLPHHNMLLCWRRPVHSREGVDTPTHARDPHQHQLWYGGDKAAPGATNHPVSAARRRVLGFNCNTLLLAMFTSCQISNSLNI